MTDTNTVNLTPEQRTIVAKLRYMARQYTNGSLARGGSGSRPHYLDEAADAIEELAQRAAAPVGEVKPVAWEGGEGWESLAWQLCADENGEEACNELIWEGGPIPEPWGDRWMKYEPEAKRMIAMVRQFTTQPAPPEGWRPIETAPKDGTVILLASGERVTAGHWEPERWPTAAEYHSTTGEYLGQHETGECFEAWWYSEDGGFSEEHPPTHWMPLPAAPQPGDN